MSYSICNIICGQPLPQAMAVELDSYGIEDITAYGFEGLYTAGGPGAGYCGVKLGEFDRGSDEKVADLLPRLVATDEQRAEARKLLAEAKVKIKEQMDELEVWGDEEKQRLLSMLGDEPEIWIVWSDS